MAAAVRLTWRQARSRHSKLTSRTPAIIFEARVRQVANLALLARRGMMPQFQRPKPHGEPMPRHLARGNASRVQGGSPWSTSSPPRSAAFRTVGLARATTKLGLAHLVTNMRRLV